MRRRTTIVTLVLVIVAASAALTLRLTVTTQGPEPQQAQQDVCLLGEWIAGGFFVPLVWADVAAMRVHRPNAAILRSRVTPDGLSITFGQWEELNCTVLNLPRYAEGGEAKILDDITALRHQRDMWQARAQWLEAQLQKAQKQIQHPNVTPTPERRLLPDELHMDQAP